MTFNTRVVKKTGEYNGKKYVYYGIHEVFNDEDGNIDGVTTDPMDITSETILGLKNYFFLLAQAFAKPVLDYDKIPCANPKDAEIEEPPMFQE